MKKKTNLRRSIYKIYIIVFILIFISMLTNVMVSYSYLKKTIEKSNKHLFYNISLNVQQVVSEFATVYNHVINSSYADSIPDIMEYKDFFRDSDIQSLMKYLQSYTTKETEYFVYVADKDVVISPSGIYKSNIYFKNISDNYKITYKHWRKGISEDSYIPLKKVGNAKENSVQCNISFSNDKRIFLSAVFKNVRFLNANDNDEWIVASNIYIKEKNGQTILKMNNIKNKNVRTNFYSRTLPFFTTNAELIIEYPFSNFFTPIIGYLKSIGILTMVVIITELILMLYFRKNSLKPIKNIISLMEVTGYNSNLNDMYESIKKLLETKKINMELSKQLTRLHKEKKFDNLISCMIKPRTYEYVATNLSNNDIIDVNSGYYLFSVKTDSIQRLFEKSNMTNEERYSDLVFILDNIASEIFGEKNLKCRVFSVNEFIVGIVSAEKERNIDAADVAGLINKTTYSIQSFFEITLTFVIGSYYDDACKLSVAYSEIKYLWQYKSIMKIEEPLCAKDINHDSTSSVKDIFDANTENMFINNVSFGNADEAISILNTVFDKVRESKLSIVQMKIIIFGIAYSFCKISFELTIPDKNDALNSFFAKIYAEEDIEKCFGILCDFTNIVCSERSQRKALSTTKNKIDDCLEYIESCYSDSNINLNIASIVLQIDSGYLSKNFKEQTGYSFNDYLTKLRIEHAKKALRNTSLSINSVFSESGFTNLRTFNRVFKKYEGVTPTEYRNSIF